MQLSICLTLCTVLFSFTAYGGLRLDNGTSSSGILKFRLSNGTWGAVCSHGFNWRAANVACTQLGYDYGDYVTW